MPYLELIKTKSFLLNVSLSSLLVLSGFLKGFNLWCICLLAVYGYTVTGLVYMREVSFRRPDKNGIAVGILVIHGLSCLIWLLGAYDSTRSPHLPVTQSRSYERKLP